MVWLLASGGDSTTLTLLTALGATGLTGSVISFVKLRGEKDSLAVSQAQGAMETMQELNKALERALARADARAEFYKRQYREVVAERNELVARWGPFPDHAAVVDILDDPEASEDTRA